MGHAVRQLELCLAGRLACEEHSEHLTNDEARFLVRLCTTEQDRTYAECLAVVLAVEPLTICLGAVTGAVEPLLTCLEVVSSSAES